MPLDDANLTLRLIYAVWWAALGGAIGSFLNVVVYRLPAGLGLLHPPSHCPRCKRPIRWYDNVPVLGWFMLGGRCRDCGARISPRYPAVEAVTAMMFLSIAWAELLGGSAQPAVMPTAEHRLGVVLLHLLLLSTLLAASLIHHDGHRLPWRLLAPAAIVGLLAPVVWPWLRVTPMGNATNGPLGALAAGILGLTVGAAVGWLVGCRASEVQRPGIVATAACIGAVLGYQAVGVIALAVVAVALVQTAIRCFRPSWQRLPTVGWLTLATFCYLVAWKLVA